MHWGTLYWKEQGAMLDNIIQFTSCIKGYYTWMYKEDWIYHWRAKLIPMQLITWRHIARDLSPSWLDSTRSVSGPALLRHGSARAAELVGFHCSLCVYFHWLLYVAYLQSWTCRSKYTGLLFPLGARTWCLNSPKFSRIQCRADRKSHTETTT